MKDLAKATDAIIPMAVVGTIFLILGILLVLFPDKVRKFDDRLVRYVPDKDQYAVASRLFGFIFCFLGIALIVVAFFVRMWQ